MNAMLTGGDLITLLPLLVLTAAAIVLMLVATVWRDQRTSLIVTVVGLAATVGSLVVVAPREERQVTPLLRLDDYALFFIAVLALATLAVALLSFSYLRGREPEAPEFYLLLLTAVLGAATLTASTHFASFFLGLEILSVSLFALIAYPRLRASFVEAGVKYLVLAGVTSAFLLFGMALIYAQTGTMTVAGLAQALVEGRVVVAGREVEPVASILVAGVALMLVGIGFKLALVPFHLWTPDVYQGAPTPVTAFIATVSKGAMIALLVRYFRGVDLGDQTALFWAFAAIAFASMVVGNLLALLQDNIKRLLAYSSIAHLGYMVVAFLAAGELAVTAVALYVVVYFVANLVAFGVVGELSGAERDAELITDYRGLAVRRPWLAGAMAAALFSLAGMPLTAGFVGKFYLVRAGAGEALWWLVMTLVLTSALSLYYYVRVIVVMYVQPPLGGEVGVAGGSAAEAAGGAEDAGGGGAAAASRPGPAAPAALSPRPTAWTAALVLAVTSGLLVFLGVYPTPLVDLIDRVAQTLP